MLYNDLNNFLLLLLVLGEDTGISHMVRVATRVRVVVTPKYLGRVRVTDP